MPKYRAADLAEWSSGKWHQGAPAEIRGFSIDSRILKQGEIFVALETERRDGHNYLNSAKNRRASGALVSRIDEKVDLPQLLVENTLQSLQKIAAEWRRRFPGPVIGITGSCGKTSTKELLALLLGDAGVHKTRANLNNQIGVPLTLLEIDPTHHRYALVEAGSNTPGEIELLAKLIDSTQSLITGVAPAHLENFGTVENIAHEKAQLGRFTRADGTVVFPHSCSRYASFHDFSATSMILVPEGVSGPLSIPESNVVHWRARRGSLQMSGCRMTLRQPPSREKTFEVPPCSPGMVANSALAVVMAMMLGRSEEAVQDGLRKWRPAPFRGELREIGEKRFYVDCYNANPASMADALIAFTQSTAAELSRMYILGCMAELGEQAPQLHREVGALIRLNAGDRVLIIGEEARYFQNGMVEAGNSIEQITVLESLDEAREILENFEGAIFLKGSRAYGLEALVPSEGNAQQKKMEEAC